MHGHSELTRDIDIRLLLRSQLADRYAGDAGTVVVEEMGILWGDRRVDIGVVNGELHGYEIKSDADDLSRLVAQAAAYGRVFDRLTLVVGTRHLVAAMKLLPEWWGIEAVEGQALTGRRLVDIRPPQLNPERDPYAIAQLLWKAEAAAILEASGRAIGRSLRRADLHAEVAREIAFNDLRAEVRAALKLRANWRVATSPS